jgi:(+)-trans-carveol dehydrogenase
MTGRVEGKVAFITGAARGQGRSHAIRLAQEGADIIAVDICDQVASVPYPMATPQDLVETVKEVEALDRRIVATPADVRDYAGLKQALDDGVAQLGRLDIVCSNAGIASYGQAAELDETTWQDMIDIQRTEQFAEASKATNALPVPWVEPADISEAVLYLASDEARYVTGVTFPVDAGFTAR